MEVTCSFDPDDYVSWCGVLDPSIPEPEVIDSDWSFQESPPCAEDASPEQSQAWAVVSPDDVASTDSVQKAEALAAEADRTSSCSISDGDGEKIVVFSSLLPMLLPVERAKVKASLKVKRRNHRVSSATEVAILGDRDQRQEVAKDRKWSSHVWKAWSCGSDLLEAVWCFKLLL